MRGPLKVALASRGRPAQVYVDNGAGFIDSGLRRAGAVLGITLTHSQPGKPAGRGKIVRYLGLMIFRLVCVQVVLLRSRLQEDKGPGLR